MHSGMYFLILKRRRAVVLVDPSSTACAHQQCWTVLQYQESCQNGYMWAHIVRLERLSGHLAIHFTEACWKICMTAIMITSYSKKCKISGVIELYRVISITTHHMALLLIITQPSGDSVRT